MRFAKIKVMAPLKITEFTDPGCPFAWSAEPARRRIGWLYGDQLEWELRMAGLADDGSAIEKRGFTPDRQSQAFRRLAHEHHMPMDTGARPRMAATVPACRAVVAVRRHRPERERACCARCAFCTSPAISSTNRRR